MHDNDIIWLCPKCGVTYGQKPENEYPSNADGSCTNGVCRHCGGRLIKTKYTDKECFEMRNPYSRLIEEYATKDEQYSPEEMKYWHDKREREKAERRKALGISSYTGRTSSSKKSNVPKCPICGSTSLSKISNAHKVGKIALFGIFGMGDNGKTWKCNNCGSKF